MVSARSRHAVQEVLRPPGQDQAGVAGPMGGLGGRRDPLGRESRLVDRRARIAAEVLDREAGQPGGAGAGRSLGDGIRFVGEAVLEVGRHRGVDRAHDRCRVRERLVVGHRAVEPSERRREAAARRGQGLEAQGEEQPGRPLIPGVRHEQRTAGHVQRTKGCNLVSVGGHATGPYSPVLASVVFAPFSAEARAWPRRPVVSRTAASSSPRRCPAVPAGPPDGRRRRPRPPAQSDRRCRSRC